MQVGERTTFTLRYRNFGPLIRCINEKISDFNAIDEFRVTPPINHYNRPRLIPPQA
jgi:hypothetical protein